MCACNRDGMCPRCTQEWERDEWDFESLWGWKVSAEAGRPAGAHSDGPRYAPRHPHSTPLEAPVIYKVRCDACGVDLVYEVRQGVGYTVAARALLQEHADFQHPSKGTVKPGEPVNVTKLGLTQQ